MKSMRLSLLLLVMLSILFSSCGTATPTPVVSPGDTPEPPTRTPPATPTVPASATPDAWSLTETAIATAWLPFEERCGYQGLEFISPNGEWAFCDSWSLARDDGLQWELAYFDQPNFPSEYSLDYIHWTQDGRTLFFAPAPAGDGGRGIWLANGYTLIRVDLQTGQESEIVPLTFDDDNRYVPRSYSFSIAPDDRQLVSIDHRNIEALVFRDFQTGEERQLALPGGYNDAGWFTWSPDGRVLVFYQVAWSPDDGCGTAYESIRWLEVGSLTLGTILQDIPVDPCIEYLHMTGGYDVREVSATTVTLDQDGALWTFDLQSGQMDLVATAVPAPKP